MIATAPHAERAAPAGASPAYAWYVVVVLMLAYILSFVDRQILSLLVGPTKAEFGVSDTAIGLLQGLAFAAFYTLFGVPMGWVVDRYRRVNRFRLTFASYRADQAAMHR